MRWIICGLLLACAAEPTAVEAQSGAPDGKRVYSQYQNYFTPNPYAPQPYTYSTAFPPVRPGSYLSQPYDLVGGYWPQYLVARQPDGHVIVPTGPNGYVYAPTFFNIQPQPFSSSVVPWTATLAEPTTEYIPAPARPRAVAPVPRAQVIVPGDAGEAVPRGERSF